MPVGEDVRDWLEEPVRLGDSVPLSLRVRVGVCEVLAVTVWDADVDTEGVSVSLALLVGVGDVVADALGVLDSDGVPLTLLDWVGVELVLLVALLLGVTLAVGEALREPEALAVMLWLRVDVAVPDGVGVRLGVRVSEPELDGDGLLC